MYINRSGGIQALVPCVIKFCITAEIFPKNKPSEKLFAIITDLFALKQRNLLYFFRRRWKGSCWPIVNPCTVSIVSQPHSKVKF